jgi:fructose-1,6-bisphosphatase/inositol monophosphatase family enzyme
LAFDKELVVAKQIALKAGDIMLEYFDAGHDTEMKEDGSPVTVADKKVNRMVIEELEKAFPDDGIVGEEESTAEYGSGRRWICDPLDGTLSYTWGLPCSTFSLGLAIDGRPVLGVVYDPFLKRLYWGVQGQGSFCDGKPLQVSNEDITEGIVGISVNIQDVYEHKPYITNLLAYGKQPAIFDGAVRRGCLIASGKLAGYPTNTGVKPHDLAAIHVLIEEAGGKVTTISGQPLDYSQPFGELFKGAVLSNGVAHQQLLELFNE